MKIVALLVALLTVACVAAQPTVVVGNVYQHGIPIEGVQVRAECNGNVAYSELTDENGMYAAEIFDGCGYGDYVTACIDRTNYCSSAQVLEEILGKWIVVVNINTPKFWATRAFPR